MEKCTLCGKSCKNLAGLAGHIQWKHPGYKLEPTVPKRQKINQGTHPRQPQQEPYQQYPQQNPYQMQHPCQQQYPQDPYPPQTLYPDPHLRIDRMEREREHKEVMERLTKLNKKQQQPQPQREDPRVKRLERRIETLIREDKRKKQINNNTIYGETPEPTPPPPIEPKKEKTALTIADHKEPKIEDAVTQIKDKSDNAEDKSGDSLWWLGIGITTVGGLFKIGYDISNLLKKKTPQIQPHLLIAEQTIESQELDLSHLSEEKKILYPSDLSTCAVGNIQQILNNQKIIESPLSEALPSSRGRIAETDDTKKKK